MTRRELLAELVRLRSISSPLPHENHLGKAARLIASALEATGATRAVGLHRAVGGAPPVVTARAGTPGGPLVVLYAHFDVVDADPAGWASDPWNLEERDGRLFGRGTADDKAGVVAIIEAVRARPDSGLDLLVVLDGAEEAGSPGLGNLLRQLGCERAQVAVVVDGANPRVGTPGLLTSMRGRLRCDVEVRTLEAPVHSGFFGGAVPDAVAALVAVLGSLHDREGAVTVSGLGGSGPEASRPALSPDEIVRDAGLLSGVRLIGRGSLEQRLAWSPAITITGIDAPDVAAATNQLLARAKARLDVRLPPDVDPREAVTSMTRHLEQACPWGAQLTVSAGALSPGFVAALPGRVRRGVDRAFASWPCPVVEMGEGGNIPTVGLFAELCEHAAIVVTGVADPACAAHGSDESVAAVDFERACDSHALLLDALAHVLTVQARG